MGPQRDSRSSWLQKVSLFHQEDLIPLLAADRTEDYLTEKPSNGQYRDNQQHQLQSPKNGVCLAWLDPGVPRLLGFGFSLGIQQILRGCGVELGYEFLLHKTTVSGWLEDLEVLPSAGQVHDGADFLARELVLPCQRAVVGFPVDGPAWEEHRDKVQAPRENSFMFPPRNTIKVTSRVLRKHAWKRLDLYF